jgi:hypothetical protein
MVTVALPVFAQPHEAEDPWVSAGFIVVAP